MRKLLGQAMPDKRDKVNFSILHTADFPGRGRLSKQPDLKMECGRVSFSQFRMRRYSSRQGAIALLMDGTAVKSAFALLLSKVTKHIPPQTALALVFDWNMVYPKRQMESDIMAVNWNAGGMSGQE